MKKIDIEYLKSRFEYSPESGKLQWKEVSESFSSRYKSWNSKNADKEAGYLYQGYRYVRIDGKNMLVHRICYAIYYGEFPINIIDHLDGDKLNNKILNLGASNPESNARNAKLNIKNRSGLSGVAWSDRDRVWYAQIGSGKNRVNRSFNSLLDACCFRKALELKLNYSENHGKIRG